MTENIDVVEGDFVVYPTHGVGRVTGVDSQTISGFDIEVISVYFESERMTLRVPKHRAADSGLRKLSSRKLMDDALKVLRGKAKVKRTMWSRRAQEYETKINSGDPIAIAEVVRDLHRDEEQPEQSFSERQIYQSALGRLTRELAAIDGIDEQAAESKLATFLKKVA